MRTRVSGRSMAEFLINALAGLAIFFTPNTLIVLMGCKAQAAVASSVRAVVDSH